MTALITTAPAAEKTSDVLHVSVFGVPWPVYKVVAVVAAVLVAALTYTFTESGATAMWASAGVLLTVWWVGYRVFLERWDHGERDSSAENRDRL